VTALGTIVAAWLFAIGLYGVVTSRNLVHLVVSLSVSQASTYVLLLAVGTRAARPGPPARAVDPVLQALASTDVVVAVVIAALLLALVVQVHKRTGSLDPDALRRLPE